MDRLIIDVLSYDSEPSRGVFIEYQREIERPSLLFAVLGGGGGMVVVVVSVLTKSSVHLVGRGLHWSFLRALHFPTQSLTYLSCSFHIC